MNPLHEVMDLNSITSAWHCISEPKDLSEPVRTEEIADLDAAVPVKRIKLVDTETACTLMQPMNAVPAIQDKEAPEGINRIAKFHNTEKQKKTINGYLRRKTEHGL